MFRLFAVTLALACSVQQSTSPAEASMTARAEGTRAVTIVLVHGAWADASGWQEVIPSLQQAGYRVVAVQNPLVSLSNDVETTKRVIDAASQQGPVVVVAHSYGGTVATAAAAGNPNVKALVFLSAFTPDANEPFGAFLDKYPAPLGQALVPDAAGFVYIDPAKFRAVFAADLSERQTNVMAATQKPLFGAILGQAPTSAAWHTIPSWYLITLDDQAISPDLQRLYAGRMNAKITEIRSSHVSFLSHARAVSKLILDAAATVQ